MEKECVELSHTMIEVGLCPVINSFYNDSTYRQRYPEICTMKDIMAFGVYRPM
jgi:hypothetical protein